MIRVSNIMGIEPKPFDPMTYVEEDVFETDESGMKKRIRLEDNNVRWRAIKNRDGTTSVSKYLRPNKLSLVTCTNIYLFIILYVVFFFFILDKIFCF